MATNLATGRREYRIGAWLFDKLDADVFWRSDSKTFFLEWSGSNGQTYTHEITSLCDDVVRADKVLAVKLKLSLA